MARTPRFAALQRLARETAREFGGRAGPTRRQLLTGAAATALLPRRALAKEARVAVIGAGLAGLSAAYALSKAGIRADIFEGSTRIGGRCYTARSFRGQIAEHGGEFIDSEQTSIQALAKEFGLPLDDVLAAEPKGSIDLYQFGNGYSVAEAQHDYRAVYPIVQSQSDKIGSPGYTGSNAFARRLDHMSTADWVAAFVPGGRASKLGQLIENAISEEYAADTDRLSALVPPGAFVDAPKNKFDLYYSGSDQRYHVRGGNDQIVYGLASRLGGRIETGTALVGLIKRDDGRIRVLLRRDEDRRECVYDRVIVTVPFNLLSELDIGRAGFRPLKLGSIRTLAMGSSMKFQLRFDRRVWHDVDGTGEIRLPSRYFQTTWDVTRAQPGVEGILNFWSGGAQADRGSELDVQTLARRCLLDAESLLPGLSRAWTGEVLRDYWRWNPWSRGSYAYYPLGYVTTYGGIEGEAEGHVHFAGEHTAADSGYLDAAVSTGESAAAEVIAALS